MLKEIIALQEYTDKYISLYEGQIRNINQNLANTLIEQGIVAEHESDEKISSLEDLLLTASITETPGMTTTYTCNLTYDNIKDYFVNKFGSSTKQISNYPILIEHKISSSPDVVQKYLGSINGMLLSSGINFVMTYHKFIPAGNSVAITIVNFTITKDNTVTGTQTTKQL